MHFTHCQARSGGGYMFPRISHSIRISFCRRGGGTVRVSTRLGFSLARGGVGGGMTKCTLPPLVTANVKPPPQANPFTRDLNPTARPSAPRESPPVPTPPNVWSSLSFHTTTAISGEEYGRNEMLGLFLDKRIDPSSNVCCPRG